MKIRDRSSGKMSGIQKKYLKYMFLLLGLALLLSSVGVWIYVREPMADIIIDKYKFMNERMADDLDSLYRRSDEVTGECIMDDTVQKSLTSKGLEEVEENALAKYFAYVDLDHVSAYCFIDNKKNVYAKSYLEISYRDFEESGLDERMGSEYAQTKWMYTKDVLFGTGRDALFIGRYVRSTEYAHAPGVLIFKMDEHFLNERIQDEEGDGEVASGIVDENGTLCASNYPDGFRLGKEAQEAVLKLAEQDGGDVTQEMSVDGGVLEICRSPESGLMVFTMIPDTVLDQGLRQILFVLAAIYLFVVLIAVAVSLYISRIFTRPIQKISREMEQFDGQDFDRKIDLHTNTELDKIGEAYNRMTGNIQQLLEEIKSQEKELRTSELNMLISQINPHFLYNTLDTIYMLARLNQEETTMKMIHALSKYLRLSLSKGHDIVTVEDELENVRSYMEIQQIRNKDLFCYEIDCRVEARERWVLKLILQPLVENAIKYGFRDLFCGGIIRIRVDEEDGRLTFYVFNSGTPIEQEMAEKLNALSGMPVTEMKTEFPGKQNGYGMVNIITRLRLKYGEQVVCRFDPKEEGTECMIQLPGDGKEKDEV